jgi:hypothetical protein
MQELACGIIDLKSDEALKAAEAALNGQGGDPLKDMDMSSSGDSSEEDSKLAEQLHLGPSSSKEAASSSGDRLRMRTEIAAPSHHDEQLEHSTQGLKIQPPNSSAKKKRDRPRIVEI